MLQRDDDTLRSSSPAPWHAGAAARRRPMWSGPALTLMVGVTLLAAAALRLGFLADFISAPVLTGFKAGIAIVIVVDQIPKLLGIHVAKGTFLQSLVGIVQHVPGTRAPRGAGPRAAGAHRRARTLPAEGRATGRGGGGNRDVGGLRTGAVRRRTRRAHSVGAPAARRAGRAPRRHALAGRRGHRAHELRRDHRRRPGVRARRGAAADPDRELLATGLANVVGSAFHNMPSGGGTSQTAVNRAAGARIAGGRAGHRRRGAARRCSSWLRSSR